MIFLDFLGDFLPVKTLLPILISAFLAILFLQSGLDKVLNWKGNLDWLTGHFSKTFLKGSVTPMLAVVTFLEVSAGFCTLIGIFEILIYQKATFALLGAELSASVLVMLFFGQRIAQDYEGAANLVPYFILSIIGMFFFSVL